MEKNKVGAIKKAEASTEEELIKAQNKTGNANTSKVEQKKKYSAPGQPCTTTLCDVMIESSRVSAASQMVFQLRGSRNVKDNRTDTARTI